MADDLNQRADELVSIARADPNTCLGNIYVCMANTCSVLTAYLQDKGEEGWAARIVDDNEEPLFSVAEQASLEETFASAPWVYELLSRDMTTNEPRPMPSRAMRKKKTQAGGAVKLPAFKTTGLTVGTTGTPGFGITGADVSLDKMFQKLLDQTTKADEIFTKISMETPGFLKLIYDHPGIPMPGFPAIMIPLPPLVSLAIHIIDSIRLSGGLAGEKNTALTILVLMEELLTGQWRQMLLTSLGFISPSGQAAGVLLKYIVNAWVLINPAIREDLLRDIYKATKSLLIGFLLWAGTTLPPTAVKLPMKAVLSQFTGLVSKAEDQLAHFEDMASKPLAPIGKKIQFTGMDLDKIKSLTIEDIQNLQSFAQWDLLVCTKEFQDILASIEENPILRLIVELLNVPTMPEDKYKVCGSEPYPSLEDKIQEALAPQVVDDLDAQAGGGSSGRKQSRYGKSRRRHQAEKTNRATRKNSIWD